VAYILNGVADTDPYIANCNGAQWFINQNTLQAVSVLLHFRTFSSSSHRLLVCALRNCVIDLRQIPASASGTGFHWQVSQATSLINIVMTMSTAPGNAPQGTTPFSFFSEYQQHPNDFWTFRN
jgi:glucan 1,3-beta-glucosidase